MASMASSEDRPSRRRSSKALSKLAESLTFSSRSGNHEPTVRRARNSAARGSRFLKRTSDRKSTRLNSSHSQISYAVFCLRKKTKQPPPPPNPPPPPPPPHPTDTHLHPPHPPLSHVPSPPLSHHSHPTLYIPTPHHRHHVL